MLTIQSYPDILYGYVAVSERDTSCFRYINLCPSEDGCGDSLSFEGHDSSIPNIIYF